MNDLIGINLSAAITAGAAIKPVRNQRLEDAEDAALHLPKPAFTKAMKALDVIYVDVCVRSRQYRTKRVTLLSGKTI